MSGIYTNDQNEIVACLAAPSETKDKKGLAWHDCPRSDWPDTLVDQAGLRCWAFIDGQVVPANETERAAAAARIERDQRLAALDKKELALTGRLRIARRAVRHCEERSDAATPTAMTAETPEITALEAELVSLDTTKQALRDLPTSAGWPHKINWPVYNG